MKNESSAEKPSLAQELKNTISYEETVNRHLTMKFINSFYKKEKELHDDFSVDSVSSTVKELLALFKMRPEMDLVEFEKEIIHVYLEFINDGDVDRLIEKYAQIVRKHDHAPHSAMLDKVLNNFKSIL